MQHSKCCVVSQPPWVQIPALPPLPPGPIGAGRFCYARMGVSACECCVLLLVAPLVFRAPEGPAAVCTGGRRPGLLMVLLVAPRVFRAPEGPAAREARRPHFVRRRASKPARALRSLRRPSHQWGRVADRRVVSKPGQAPPPPINFARNSPAACSNIELASLELQRFWGVSKNDHDKLRAKFGRRWCRCCPRAPRPGPVDRVARLSDTAIAFPGAGRASTETVIAFAGEKRVFLVQFSGAEVMSVSTVAVQGCAVVMVVSCWSTSVAAEVSLVAKSPRAGSCARKSSPCLV